MENDHVYSFMPRTPVFAHIAATSCKVVSGLWILCPPPKFMSIGNGSGLKTYIILLVGFTSNKRKRKASLERNQYFIEVTRSQFKYCYFYLILELRLKNTIFLYPSTGSFPKENI